ncbi:MAG: amidohydrolase family protein [Pirellulales bacterium]|nr:amidohydrolase family protein [Pirellulales bacterium]
MAGLLVIQFPSHGMEATESENPGSIQVLQADWIVQPDGTLKPDTAIVIQGGKIREILAAADVKEYEVCPMGKGTVLCPGLIDLFGTVGAVGQTAEMAHVVDPDARAVDAIDPYHKDLVAALRSGITSAVVSPAPNNLVSGTSVCFRTLAKEGKLDILRKNGPLVFSIGESVWQRERIPTSRIGLLDQMRTLVHRAQAGEAHPGINAVFAGQADAVIFCEQGQDVAAARDVLGDRMGQFAVVHSQDAMDLATKASQWSRPVVVGPYTFSSNRRELLGAGLLSKNGVDVAFRGGFPNAPPEGLRITAALAVRFGMDPAAARRAMTVIPARVAGVEDRIGAIEPGQEADLVLFSGDPLRLDSTIRAVFIQGVRTYPAANQESSAGGEQ